MRDSARVTTVEGLAKDGALHPVDDPCVLSAWFLEPEGKDLVP